MGSRADKIINEYFEWIYDIACGDSLSPNISYRKLFMRLHSTEFRYYLDRDGGRYDDGLDLRYRFGYKCDIPDAERYIQGPCSVLEMMIALAIICEERIMDNVLYGDRTSQWFWNMITNMGLGAMDDNRYDEEYVDEVVNRFLERDYAPNGEGGLFRIDNADRDLRDVEIWWQLCWYLNNMRN